MDTAPSSPSRGGVRGLDRRQFLVAGAATFGALRASAGLTAAAEVATPAGPASPHGSMMWDHIMGAIWALDEQRQARLARLKSPEQVWVMQQRVRSRLAEMWGNLPAERTPLNVRNVGSVERADLVVEKVIFESRPSFYVTANVHRLKQATGRSPGIIFPPGHSAAGKAYGVYQQLCMTLARNGFVVLIWDPLGQGERLQLWDPGRRASLKPGSGTGEHMTLGQQGYLVGINLMQYRVWDAMRVIDYLESRDDVDADRIGCVGQSGGGMETLQLAPFETRLRAAVSACAVSTFRHKSEALLIPDAEQDLVGTFAYGIDHPELLAAVAPRAFLIEAAVHDMVPLDGARRTHNEVKHVYEVLGCPEKIALVETNDKHGLNQQLREAAASWMVRWLQGKTEQVRETVEEPFPEKELWCTQTGQVADSLGGETVGTLNLKLADRITPKRRSPANRAEFEVYRRDIARLVERITMLDLEKDEPGIVVPTRSFGTSSGAIRIAILVAESGKDDSALLREVIEPIVAGGYRVVGIDVRGWGETTPRMEMGKRYSAAAWEEFFAFRALELNQPLFGQRLRDVLTTAPKLARENEWLLIGVGAGALLAAHAAVLEPRIGSVVTVGGLLSYRSILEDPLYRQPLSVFLPGVLAAYEVCDVLAAIAPRRLLVINPEDARRKPTAAEVVAKRLEWTSQVYRAVDAAGSVSIRCGVAEHERGAVIARWLSS